MPSPGITAIFLISNEAMLLPLFQFNAEEIQPEIADSPM
jgi:hypothetical protein